MDIVIMDLDGVLCDNSHRAHLVPPADQQYRNEAWQPFVAECVNDAPIAAGVAMYQSLCKAGHKIVIVTSRQGRFAGVTKKWMVDNGVTRSAHPWESGEIKNADTKFRRSSDHSSPAEYKRNTLNKLRDEGYNILFAIDDDPAIIAMYNAEGIATFQPSTRCSSCK